MDVGNQQPYFLTGGHPPPATVIGQIRRTVRERPLLPDLAEREARPETSLHSVDYEKLDAALQRWRRIDAPWQAEEGSRRTLKRWLNRLHALFNRPQANHNQAAKETVDVLLEAIRVLDNNNRRLLDRVRQLEDRLADPEP